MGATSPRVGATAGLAPPVALRLLMQGYMHTQLVYVAARLGLADALCAGPLDSAQLAALTGAAPDALHRIVRGLVNIGLLAECDDGAFALTPVGACLCRAAPGSLHDLALVHGAEDYTAWAHLLHTAYTGEPAFDCTAGVDFFTHLARDLAAAQRFHGFMAQVSGRAACALLTAYDFGAARSVVDVGGGTGVVLTRLLVAHPHLRAMLVDQPPVVAQARQTLAAADVLDRCTLIGSDFFVAVPPGGDAYLLCQVLHNWSDAACARLLHNCRRALSLHGRLLIVEQLLPHRVRPRSIAVESDLYMLTMTGGRERTAGGYGALLAAAGFSATRVTRTASPWAVVEARP